MAVSGTRAAWLLAVAVFVIPAPAYAQAPAATPAAVAKRLYDDAAALVVKSAEMVPEASYTFKPTPDVRSFGQLVAHLVDGQNFYCASASQRVQWSTPAETALGTKAEIIAKLKSAVTACDAAYDAQDSRLGPLLNNLGHTNLHYGNIITYMRLMKLVPPSS